VILDFLKQDIAGSEIVDIYLSHNHHERYAVDFARIIDLSMHAPSRSIAVATSK